MGGGRGGLWGGLVVKEWAPRLNSFVTAEGGELQEFGDIQAAINKQWF